VIKAKAEKYNSVSQSGAIDLRPAVFIKDLQKRSIILEEEKAIHKSSTKVKSSENEKVSQLKEENQLVEQSSLSDVEIPPKFQKATEILR
jgi:hypothetical protein